MVKWQHFPLLLTFQLILILQDGPWTGGFRVVRAEYDRDDRLVGKKSKQKHQLFLYQITNFFIIAALLQKCLRYHIVVD